jgi:hypothetical protein
MEEFRKISKVKYQQRRIVHALFESQTGGQVELTDLRKFM